MADSTQVATANNNDSNSVPTLYWFKFSMCALMARYTLDVQRKHAQPGDELRYNLETIDIYTNEQLSESFLKINPMGQVPALSRPLKENTTDSHDIILWAAQEKPSLLPASHVDRIMPLLNTLHGLTFFVLTFYGYEDRRDLIVDGINELLAGDNISESYRKALEYKKEYMIDLNKRTGGLLSETLVKTEQDVRDLFVEIAKVLPKAETGSKWLFDLPSPTVLDPSVVALIARLHDCYRDYLIPSDLDEWARQHLDGDVWQEMTQGQPTWYHRLTGRAKPPAVQPGEGKE